MPGSDDQYDQVHTYSQDHAGKSKTTKPAVREIGRDGAPVQLYVGEARSTPRTPPAGVVYLFIDDADDSLKQIDSTGTVTNLTGGKSTEQVQDDVGSIMNAPLDYDDATPAYDISLSAALQVDANNDLDVVDEAIQDIAGALAGTLLAYDDAGNAINVQEASISHDGIDQATVSSADHHAKYTDEEAQDAVGTILGGQFTYDDAGNSITLNQGEGSGLNADSWEGYDLQKNGTDGTGVINFKT